MGKKMDRDGNAGQAVAGTGTLTPKGYVLIGKMRNTAVLFRPGNPYLPFVVAPGYDESDGSWHGNGRYLDNPIDAWKEAWATVNRLAPKIVLSGRLDEEDGRHSVGPGVYASNFATGKGEWELFMVTGESFVAHDYGEGIECSYAERCGDYVKSSVVIDDYDYDRKECFKAEVTFLIDPEYVTGMIEEEA